MSAADVALRVSSRFDSRFLQYYTRGKIRNDNIYEAVANELRGSNDPLYDLGCGVGILEMYLRELGFEQRMIGIDHDRSKVEAARVASAPYGNLEFIAGDARQEIPAGMNVVALDVIHYFLADDRRRILETMARAVPPGGVAIVRDAVRDESLRYHLTAIQERFSRAIRWLKAERLDFPSQEALVAPFREQGFTVEARPMWGATPFNNYFFVFRRPASGTTNR